MAEVSLKFGEYHRAALRLGHGGAVASATALDESTDYYAKRDDAVAAAGNLFIRFGSSQVQIVSDVMTEDAVARVNAGRKLGQKKRDEQAGL